jgi:hypothetical protein
MPSMKDQEEYDALCVSITNSNDRDVVRMIDSWVSAKDEPARDLLASYRSVRPFKSTQRFGATLLHMVCDMGFIDAFEHILGLNSDPEFMNAKMDDGSTALHLCLIATRRNAKCDAIATAMTKALIARGADIFAIRDLTGAHAFFLACEYHNLEAAKLLLQAMLEALGICAQGQTAYTCGPEHVEALRRVLINSGADGLHRTVLHASVAQGKGDRVCRWLTGPDCKMLWAGFDDVLGVSGHGKYRRTVLAEALLAKEIHMPTIRYVCSLYVPPIPAYTLLTSYFELRQTLHPRVHDLLEFLYDEAMSRPQPTTPSRLDHHYDRDSFHSSRLTSIIKRTASSSVPATVSLIRRLVDKYPQQLTPHVIKLTAHTNYSIPNPDVVSVLIMLDWFPYTCEACATIFQLESLLPKDIRMLYIQNLRRQRGGIGALFLFNVMKFGEGCSDFWIQFVDDSSRLRGDLETIIFCCRHGLCDRTLRRSPLCINHIRFIAGLHVSRFKSSPARTQFVETLSYCKDAHRILPVLLARGILRIDSTFIRNLGLGVVSQPPLLKTVMWSSDVRPTQVCTCLAILIGYGDTISGSKFSWFMRDLIWIYNLRALIREPSTGTQTEFRMILGPRTSVPTPVLCLPVPVTRTILEFLWQGATPSSCYIPVLL